MSNNVDMTGWVVGGIILGIVIILYIWAAYKFWKEDIKDT